MITLCYEEICEILANNITLRLVMIPPALDGSPRRGCEDPNCPAIKGDGNIMLTPDTFAKQPVRCVNCVIIKYSNIAEWYSTNVEIP